MSIVHNGPTVKRTVIALAAISAVVLAGCTSSNSSTTNTGTFTTDISADPGNMDPDKATDLTTVLLNSFQYDTLINLNPQGKPVSQLASKWEATATTATYTLRKDVTCADGARLKASDVKANFDYIHNPKNESSIIGTQLPNGDYTTTADDSAGTFSITMKAPYSFLLTGAGLVPIVCAKGMANRTLLAHQTDGTGPFKLVQSVASDHYTLAVRKDYKWGPDGATTATAGVPQKVTFKVVQNPTTAHNLLLSGQLNAVDVAGQEHQRLEGHGFLEIKGTGQPFSMYFNERAGHPGADEKVRHALASALDRAQLVKVLTENSGSALQDMEPNQPKPCRIPTVPGNLPEHDVTAAKSELDAAGWVVGSGGVRSKDGKKLSVSLLYVSGTPAEDAGMELVRDWWKSIGVQVELTPRDSNALAQTLFTNGGGWDVSVFGIGVSYPSELVAFFGGPAAPTGQNFGAVDNPQYKSLTAQAGKTAGDAGCRIWADAEVSLLKRVDVIPISLSIAYSFGNKATYRFGVFGIEPTSIRMLG